MGMIAVACNRVHPLACRTCGRQVALATRPRRIRLGVELVLNLLGSARDLLDKTPRLPISRSGHNRQTLFADDDEAVGSLAMRSQDHVHALHVLKAMDGLLLDPRPIEEVDIATLQDTPLFLW